jgi:uncharacterized protein YcaQ
MLNKLRQHAIAAALFRPTTLRQAVERMGFVQADPIRSPARAQDLILRHRVKDYRAGDLDRNYERLELEEDRLYAHGFMTRSVWRMLHPPVERPLSTMEKRVLELAATRPRVHPRDLEIHFGRQIASNGWGGRSKATTLALHALHRRGLLRVAGRERGIRIYAANPQNREPLDQTERFRQLALVIASALGPLSDRGFHSALGFLGHRGPTLKALRSVVPTLVESGELAYTIADGVRYLWRADRVPRNGPNETVRFLSPFDPIVWDRQRFEQFWGWPYRFEAYVPAAKRILGYYAMPLLWRDDIIGWVNVSNQDGKLTVEPGFKKAKPKGPVFRAEFQAEVERLRMFLQQRGTPSP